MFSNKPSLCFLPVRWIKPPSITPPPPPPLCLLWRKQAGLRWIVAQTNVCSALCKPKREEGWKDRRREGRRKFIERIKDQITKRWRTDSSGEKTTKTTKKQQRGQRSGGGGGLYKPKNTGEETGRHACEASPSLHPNREECGNKVSTHQENKASSGDRRGLMRGGWMEGGEGSHDLFRGGGAVGLRLNTATWTSHTLRPTGRQEAVWEAVNCCQHDFNQISASTLNTHTHRCRHVHTHTPPCPLGGGGVSVRQSLARRCGH